MQRKTWISTLAAALVVVALGVVLSPATAQWTTAAADDWCEREGGGWGKRATFCEVREITLPAAGTLDVDAGPNGGVKVEGASRGDVLVRVKIVAAADTEAEARQLASEVEIETSGTLRARGPSSRKGRSWSASFRLQVPERSDLALETVNGGISVTGVEGDIEAHTTNGGIHLARLAGKVRGRTTNGGVSAALDGSSWQGEGLELVTTNGGVSLEVPDGYSARLEVGTTNGGIRSDLELPVTGGRRGGPMRMSVDLGSGGAPIRVTTTNGGVKIKSAG